MKAVIGEELGPAQNYVLTEVEQPQPAAGEVLIEVSVAGVGYVDALMAAGRYQVKPPVPFCPGMEVSGRVAALGDGVTGLEVGASVSGNTFGGGLAEYIVLPVTSVQVIPEQLSVVAAAGFIVNYTTAWHALIDRAAIRAGETVLVLGAAGGTGIAAIQVAKLAGARVIAGASSEEKRAYAKAHGADEVLDYTQPDWRAPLKDMTDGAGVDIVFDPVGGDLMEPAFRSLKWRGRHLVIGFTGGPIPALPINLALLKGASLVGVDLRQYDGVYEREDAARVRGLLFDAVRRGDLQPPEGTVFELAQFRDALELAGSREGLGKTTVKVRP